jgi:hypothetical protein
VRLSIVPSPAKKPGRCRFCPGISETREWFLDLGQVEDYWGRVYICNACFSDMAIVAEYEKKSANAEAVATLESRLTEVLDRNHEYVFILDAMSDLGIDLFGLLDYLALKRGKSTPRYITEAMERRKDRTAKNADGPVESVNESGPNDVPSPKRNKQLSISLPGASVDG